MSAALFSRECEFERVHYRGYGVGGAVRMINIAYMINFYILG